MRELENVVWEIMPLYQELHAYLRHQARRAYGDRITEEDGAIVSPIFEQMLLQDWYARPMFRTPYPNHQLMSVKQRLEEVYITPVRINQKAVEFFESLGLNHMSE